MEKKIYEMELHERLFISNIMYVTRVPGGWVYEFPGEGHTAAVVFVPYNEEFRIK